MRINHNLKEEVIAGKTENSNVPNDTDSVEKILDDLKKLYPSAMSTDKPEKSNSLLLFSILRGLLLELNATETHGNIVAISETAVEGAVSLSIDIQRINGEFQIQLTNKKGNNLDKPVSAGLL